MELIKAVPCFVVFFQWLISCWLSLHRNKCCCWQNWESYYIIFVWSSGINKVLANMLSPFQWVFLKEIPPPPRIYLYLYLSPSFECTVPDIIPWDQYVLNWQGTGMWSYTCHCQLWQRACHDNWNFLVKRTRTSLLRWPFLALRHCSGDVIFRHKSRSTLAQVMAWCGMTPSNFLKQCWLSISEVPSISHESDCHNDYSV